MADGHAFTSTPAGREFFGLYQALREHWPTDATDADLHPDSARLTRHHGAAAAARISYCCQEPVRH